jgi:hypothetical protein
VDDFLPDLVFEEFGIRSRPKTSRFQNLGLLLEQYIKFRSHFIDARVFHDCLPPLEAAGKLIQIEWQETDFCAIPYTPYKTFGGLDTRFVFVRRRLYQGSCFSTFKCYLNGEPLDPANR